MCVEFEKVKKGNVQFFDRLDEAMIKLEKREIHGHNDEYCKYTKVCGLTRRSGVAIISSVLV